MFLHFEFSVHGFSKIMFYYIFIYLFIYCQDFKVCVYTIYMVIVFYLLNSYFLVNFHSITHCLVCLLACLD